MISRICVIVEVECWKIILYLYFKTYSEFQMCRPWKVVVKSIMSCVVPKTHVNQCLEGRGNVLEHRHYKHTRRLCVDRLEGVFLMKLKSGGQWITYCASYFDSGGIKLIQMQWWLCCATSLNALYPCWEPSVVSHIIWLEHVWLHLWMVVHKKGKCFIWYSLFRVECYISSVNWCCFFHIVSGGHKIGRFVPSTNPEHH